MNQLNTKTVYALKSLCKEEKYKGFSKCKTKEQLIKFIISNGYLKKSNNREDENNTDTEDEDINLQETNIISLSKDNSELTDINKKTIDELLKKHKFKNYNLFVNPIYNENRTEIFNIYKREQGSSELVFHGADESNLDRILENGFCFTNKIIHGNVYGNGIYFAKDLQYALNYPKNCKERIIFVVEIWNKNIIRGDRNYSLPPLVPNTNIHYDTYVNNVVSPTIFVKTNESSYNIIGYIKINFNQLNKTIGNQHNNIQTNLYKSIKIKNNTDKDIMVYYVRPLFLQNPNDSQKKEVNTFKIHEISIKEQCKAMNCGLPIKPNTEFSIKTFVNHQFLCGYYLSKDFIATKIIKISNIDNYIIDT